MYPFSHPLAKLFFNSYWNLRGFFFRRGIRILPDRIGPIWLFGPLQMMNKSHNADAKLFYNIERKNYRLSRALQEAGVISKRDYYLHRMIAEKYGWPYIKEAYDDYDEPLYNPTD